MKRYALQGLRTLEKFSQRMTGCVNVPDFNDLVNVAGQYLSILKIRNQGFAHFPLLFPYIMLLQCRIPLFLFLLRSPSRFPYQVI